MAEQGYSRKEQHLNIYKPHNLLGVGGMEGSGGGGVGWGGGTLLRRFDCLWD
jgi:hypothetical protein